MPTSTLCCAGRPIVDPADLVRRYCGLDWSGGPSEAWAFRYFDLIPPTNPDWVEPVDVVACAALHPGLSREDLTYFDKTPRDFETWLSALPVDVDLADAGADVVAQISGLLFLSGPVGLSLLSKVAHRKRPRLIPMLDRAIIDRYRPVTGQRGEQAWPALVTAIQQDLQDDRNRSLLEDTSAMVQASVFAPVPSPLRVLDISIWMEGLR